MAILVTSKYEEDPIKIEVARVATTQNNDFSNTQGHITPRSEVKSDSAICSCGAIETTKHYLLICLNYTAVRNQVLSNYLNTPIKTLLSGDPLLNDKANQNIFKAVQTFIEQTKRFS